MYKISRKKRERETERERETKIDKGREIEIENTSSKFSILKGHNTLCKYQYYPLAHSNTRKNKTILGALDNL